MIQSISTRPGDTNVTELRSKAPKGPEEHLLERLKMEAGESINNSIGRCQLCGKLVFKGNTPCDGNNC